MSLLGALIDLSVAARLDGGPLPVIRTDSRSARLLGAAIEREWGGPLALVSMPPGVVAMFDGVEIRGEDMSNNTAGGTNTDKRHFPLRIERMPDGGFVVSDASFGGDPSRYCAPLFASSSIGEALAFICGRLDPEASKATNDAKAAEGSRAFAKSREGERCWKCGCVDRTRCLTCGRGVGVSENK